MEVLFLGLATSAGMIKACYSLATIITTVIALSLPLPICAAIGAGMLDGLRGAGLKVTLTFGCAALLYLVTEELLVEAHEVPETALSTAMFFADFLLLLVIDMLST
jgi:ZIP family zinc transporter